MTIRATRRAPALVLISVLTGSLLACSSDPNSVAEQAKSGDRTGYVAGDGTVEQLPADSRGEPLTLSGTTVDGGTWSLAADGAGRVVVVNVWGSWCGPCVAEAPDLEQVATDLQEAGEPVQFVSVNVRDTVANALAFQKVH